MGLRAVVVLCAFACLGGVALARAPRSPVLAPSDAVIDGPGASIMSLNGLSIARDGTGGLVYIRRVAGVPHVFVSALQNGGFHPPVQVDAGLPAGSSQPVIAAGDRGTVLVAFINNGALYVADRLNGGAFAPPARIYTAAENPSISMSNFGKAYLAFTATNGGGGADVRAAYYYAGAWVLDAAPLDNQPADAAGTGSGRPQVATAGDGVGIVAWGENGHIFTRRVAKTAVSVVDEQADVPALDGWGEVSSANPSIATGGDSSYASVSFQETLDSGNARQSRVLFNRLHGSRYDGIEAADGLPAGGPEGADQPQTSDTEYGRGWIVSERDHSHQLYATSLNTNDSFGSTLRVDSLANAAQPDAVSSNAGLTSTYIIWQQTPGAAGTAEIRLRFAPTGGDLGPEQVISSPSLGATDADQGLVAAGDVAGDAAAAWVQGSGATTRIVAAQLFQPPGGFRPTRSFAYRKIAQPPLSWTAAYELWGPPQYMVKIDGVAAGQTTGTTFVPVTPLTDGRHVFQVTAVNGAGLAFAARPATVFVDTVKPRVSLTLSGTRAIGYTIHLRVRYSDPPPPGLPKSAASGVRSVSVNWGDRTAKARIRRTTASHVYKRRHTYTVTVTVTDRAGNHMMVKKKLVIATTPPKHKRRHKKKKPTRAVVSRQVVPGAALRFPSPMPPR